MSIVSLPESPDAFAQATWPDIAPYYDELAARPLDEESADTWLHDWSALDELVYEASARASVAYTTDTTDPAKEAAHLRFSTEIEPQLAAQHVRLAGRLLDLGYERPDLLTTIRRFRNARELFREENIPLMAEEEKLSAAYNKVIGGLMVEWAGEEKTLPQLAPYLLDPDRAVRERAFRLRAQPYIERRDDLAAIFDQQYALRQQMARNAGFANYRDYAHQDKNRFDYTPADCVRFHDAVAETVVPAIARRLARRRQLMSLDTLRPWDGGVDPLGRPPLRPFSNVEELIAHGRAVFGQVDSVLGGYFNQMADEGLLDLASRKGKAPGGYCTGFERSHRPFIFMNAVGVPDDVTTLLHESGHAFHAFEVFQLPLLFQRDPGAEMDEVASMAMELLAAPYLHREQGGYYDPADDRRYQIDHLEGILDLLAHIASIDAFQQWIYTDPAGADRDARDAAWLRIRARFQRGVDWSGLEQERTARWYQQLHLFLYPFYYIEYGIAQLGALQVWRNARRDQAGTVAAYRRALALGATAPLPRLFEAAGARLAFDNGTMGELVALVEEHLAALEA
jgi:oligoendopeptidase F